MATEGHPPEGVERRRGEDRRRGERRSGPGRRDEDRPREWVGGFTPAAAFWALLGAMVVLYLFFVVLGAIDPDEAPVVSGVVLVLALAWLAHSWRRLWSGGASPRSDRERRGF